MVKYLTPWIEANYINKHLGYAKRLLSGFEIAQLFWNGIGVWNYRVFDLSNGQTIETPDDFDVYNIIDAKDHLDKVLLEFGYTHLSQERYEKLQALI